MPDPYENLDEYNWLADEVDFHETPQALALGVLLYDLLMPTSVLDVGCSSGIYLVPFLERGVEVLGIDGASGVGKHIPGRFQVVDLRHSWTALKRYDLCLCIEVAEHLRPEYADLLVETLARSADTIFFSAAQPGQNGEAHWNEQPKEYWLEKFYKFGMNLHPLNEAVMEVVNRDEVYKHCGWLINNGMLLVNNPAG